MADPEHGQVPGGHRRGADVDTTPERTAKFIKDELAKWAPIIKSSGVRIE